MNSFHTLLHKIILKPHCIFSLTIRGRRGRDRVVIVFTTTYAISAYYDFCFCFCLIMATINLLIVMPCRKRAQFEFIKYCQLAVVSTVKNYLYTVKDWCCGFESRSGRGVKHYVIMFVSDLRHVGGFPRILRFPPPIKLTATI